MGFHFVDLLDWTVSNYNTNESGCYIVGNQRVPVTTIKPHEIYENYIHHGWEIANPESIDDTGGGSDVNALSKETKEEKEKRIVNSSDQ